MRPRCLPQNLQHQSMKLPARKTGRTGHLLDTTRMLRRIESRRKRPAVARSFRMARVVSMARSIHENRLRCLDVSCHFSKTNKTDLAETTGKLTSQQRRKDRHVSRCSCFPERRLPIASSFPRQNSVAILPRVANRRAGSPCRAELSDRV